MPVAIISGEPGTVWQNNTGKILFQLHVNFVRSCALCIQFANSFETLVRCRTLVRASSIE
jgi:hypothetical protein